MPRNLSHNRFATAALLAASAALAVGPAAAQVQVQGGNALDANQQVGSGGSNRVENQVDYAQRNLLVTGNVGGGRAFQDNVGYVTAGGFQDALGSDSLFNFRRDSIYSSPQALGVQPRNTIGPAIVTRGTTQLPGFQSGTTLGSSTRTLYDSRSGTLSFRQNGGALVQLPGVRDLGDLASLHSLGTVRTQDGGYATLNASTLTGVQLNPLQPEPFEFNPGSSGAPQSQQVPEGLLNPELDGTIEGDRPYLDGQRPDSRDTPEVGEDPNVMMFNNGRFAPSMMLGSQINQDLAVQATQGESRSVEGSLTQLNNYIFGTAQPERAPEAPVNPYDTILDNIRDQATQDLADRPEVEVERAPWMDILDNPDEAVLDAVARARDTAIRRSMGLVDENGDVDLEAELPEIDENSELGQILSDLDYELPRLTTLSGEDREQRHNKMLVRAEQDLIAENYLSAENIYRQVLRESADNPLAKAGLIHAQLGGGMIRSAAFNLRSLFAEHPELVALRYDEDLLPSAERMRWLQRELQDMIAEDIHGAEPGLILAYLGYQLQAEPLVQYGLGIALERTPRDPLLPVLERIWLERDAE